MSYILQAGIDTNQLTIVFEEEAAISYCQHMHLNDPSYLNELETTVTDILEKEKEYMVVDFGGKCRYTLTLH